LRFVLRNPQVAFQTSISPFVLKRPDIWQFRGGAGVPALPNYRKHDVCNWAVPADDAERERRRLALGEPYRTILGHFRHEIAHYYWDRFFRDIRTDVECLASFELFAK
jgi:hypothetical protein